MVIRLYKDVPETIKWLSIYYDYYILFIIVVFSSFFLSFTHTKTSESYKDDCTIFEKRKALNNTRHQI